jgi:hypothetical protein
MALMYCPDGEVFINNTHPTPRRPARQQARTPDVHCREQQLRWAALTGGVRGWVYSLSRSSPVS